jgi:ubiquinone/menaquinone biosynthesis C-methylase UbiE
MSLEFNESSPDYILEHNRVEWIPEDILEGIETRRELLEDFANEPRNPYLWNYVSDKVIEEDSLGIDQPSELKDISANDLIEFAQSVISAKPEERYGLTAQTAPNGRLWFDVLYGFHSPSGDKAIESGIKRQLRDLDIDKVQLAVDLGTGTGNTAAVVAPFAEKTVGIDKNSSLLSVAKEKHPGINFVKASVTQLPFADNSVDVITSDGLKYALDAEATIGMFAEISRVLKQGGVYIDSEWEDPSLLDLRYHPELLKSFITWKAALQDMIADTISGKLEKVDYLDQRRILTKNDWHNLRRGLGLYEESFYSYRINAFARMLYKNPQKVASEDRDWGYYKRISSSLD